MTTEVTRKQAILLSVLCAILVIILFWQFLISPQIKSASKAKEDLETLNQQYSDLLMQSESYDQNMAALDGWNEKNSEETKKLFPLSDAERIDRFLTFVMHECGVTVNGLSIGQTMQYYIDGEDGKTYLCERTGEAAGGKIVLQYLPHELVGNYFTAV